MAIWTPTRKGETSIFLSAALWSLFPVVTILTYSSLTPLFTAAIGTLISATFFALILTAKRQWHELLRTEAWKDILLITLFLGILFYAFMFSGLRYTTAGNGAILSLMEVLFSFLILGVLLKHEPLSPRHVLGGLLMVTGALFVLLPKASGWHIGDWGIIAATACAPFGNMYTQRARKVVGPVTILFCRSILGGGVLFLAAMLLEPLPAAATLASALGLLAFNGIVLFGLCKILWIEGIHRIPITKAIALESVMPFLTLIVAYVVLHERVTLFQVSGLVPIIAGTFLLTRKASAS